MEINRILGGVGWGRHNKELTGHGEKLTLIVCVYERDRKREGVSVFI